ncbi:AAA domain-containing protein, partial [Streptomyces diastatochromogenes]|uniref:AAA domain-containing protein n=1 Tax=Streptomyces diastatochromogenes TaxID=42236 RepID=UPI0036B363FE
ARAAAEARDAEAYGAAVGELDDLREALDRKKTCDDAYRVVAAELPDIADALESAPDDPAWDTRLTEFEAAWAWSAWHARMTDLTDPEAERRQLRLLAEADADIRIGLERLAADRAWFSCLSRLTDDQAVALTSYQQNVRRLGKGTGKYAATYRRQARESLQASQEAVPAWIMPLHQVTETVPMDRAGRFDVVIIDEASQSGPEALLLAWLGAKVVVVGDDQQVSPAQVGVDHDEQFALQRRLLAELPAARRNLFTPTASLFDIASGLAGGRGRLMLQEHFRCMPEIIGFSNDLCYGGRLQPLRQYGADRLPPLRALHVADGWVEGSGQKQVNRPEAERLVETVARCIADPAYAGRSMGVITLLGAGQKFLIEDLLADRIPLDERQRRRLRVGNAEEFQGDERDVVFIGTVASLTGPDGPRRIGPYSSALNRQHLNVAASRARDQVWLFHSVTLTEWGETDLRRAYLDWFSRPAEDQDGAGLGEVRPDVPHEAFDSLFEQRVYLALRARGYRVRPQYPAGRYRIDLVVEGGTRRLAVECDGDAFHNEENADADAARQRELERVGWTFVRIRGSRFFLDPERALEPLWAELDRLGIERATADAGRETRPADADREIRAADADGQIRLADADRETRPADPVDPAAPAGAPAEPQPRTAVRQPRASVPQPRLSLPQPRPSVPRPRPAQAPTPPTRPTAPAAPQTGPTAPALVSVARLHRDELNAAQHAFSLRSAVAGSARFLSAAGVPGFPGVDAVEVLRGGRPVARLAHAEVQAMIRAAIARVDVPVLGDDGQVGVARYHAPGSPEAAQGRTTELLRVDRRPTGAGAADRQQPVARRATGRTAAQPTLPALPRQPVRTSETAAPAPERPLPRLRVDRISLGAHGRVQRELERVQDVLDLPLPEVVAVDSSSRKAQLADHEKRREALKERRSFLRVLLDKVVPDPSYTGGAVVVPGCLVGVEDPDEPGITTYEIALLAGDEAERLSPDSALGKALLWREVGDEVTWRTERGTTLRVLIRYIQD